ncbi:MAG: hypothetical protein ACP5HQ_00340 [Thermoprotei archaeon]
MAELEVSPNGCGLIQGAFAVNPSKPLAVASASDLGLFPGLASAVVFVSISTLGFEIAG